MIYFIQCGENGPIKIGISDDPQERLSQLQTANPYKLKLLWVYKGDISTEQSIHEDLKLLRIRGEWYHPGEDLFDLIDRDLRNEYQVDVNFGNAIYVDEGRNSINIYCNEKHLCGVNIC